MQDSDQHLLALARAPRPGIEVGGGGELPGPGDSTPAACLLISALKVPFHFSAAVNQKPQMESAGKDMTEPRRMFKCVSI